MDHQELNKIYCEAQELIDNAWKYRFIYYFINHYYYQLYSMLMYASICRMSQIWQHAKFPEGYEDYYKLIYKWRLIELEKVYLKGFHNENNTR